ncbi:unnamed protein product, partial [Closterium sp. NIES-53]
DLLVTVRLRGGDGLRTVEMGSSLQSLIPERSIPTGTLAAIVSITALYVVSVLLFGAVALLPGTCW